MALIMYHYGFSMDKIYDLSMSQYRSLMDNLPYVLGQEKSDKPKPGRIYDPDKDPALHPELGRAFDKALGVKIV